MKKYLSFCLFIVSIALPLSVLATSGACSYHGGVNCKVVSEAGGNAICNDGWVSSVQYSDVDECKQAGSCLYGMVDQATHDKAVSDFNTLTTNFMNDASQTFNNALKNLGSYSYADQVIAQAKLDAYNAQVKLLEGTISCPIKPSVTTTTPTSSTFAPSLTPLTINSTSAVSPLAVMSSSSYASVTQNLQVGALGQSVINLQRFLEDKRFLTLPSGTSEGYFGNLTKQALVAFQKSAGLPATGYCGPMTRAAITDSSK